MQKVKQDKLSIDSERAQKVGWQRLDWWLYNPLSKKLKVRETISGAVSKLFPISARYCILFSSPKYSEIDYRCACIDLIGELSIMRILINFQCSLGICKNIFSINLSRIRLWSRKFWKSVNCVPLFKHFLKFWVILNDPIGLH